MTTVTTHNPVRSDLTADTDDSRSASTGAGRGWALAGVAAAVTAITGTVSVAMVNAVYDPKISADAPAVLDRLTDFGANIVVFQIAGSIAALMLGVFGVGLQRRLRATMPDGSLAPGLAAFGLLATAVVMVMGTSLNTEFAFGLADTDHLVPESAVFFNHWIGTVPGCWLLVGLSALAVFAGSRRGDVPRWLGITGLVLGGLTVLVGTLPMQYMAAATGGLWLLVTAIGFAVGDRRHRAGHQG